MTYTPSAAETDTRHPAIRHLEVADLKDALKLGYEDFKAMPSHAFLLAIIYPIDGLIIARVTFGYDLLPMLFPLIAGFALLGPLAAIGLYELSRQRAMGVKLTLQHILDIFRSPSLGAIVTLSLILMAIFFAWLLTAQTIYETTVGTAVPESFSQFITMVMTTSGGHDLIIAGFSIGFLFAALVLVMITISFPLLLDRPVGTVAAIMTSARLFIRNPSTMAVWGLIVGGGLFLGSLPALAGLAVVMPILGHATWHLYRKAIV